MDMSALDEKKLDKYLDEYGLEMWKRIEEKTPVAPAKFENSGKLKASWTYTFEGNYMVFENTAINHQGILYWPFLEYGTVKMAPVGMLRRSFAEHDDVARIAREKAGL